MRDENQLISTALALWQRHGAKAGEISAHSAPTSGNNRIFILTDGQGQQVVAKKYFRDSSGGCPRLRAEWSFLQYAAQSGLTCVPRPVAFDETAACALYEYVAGDKLTVADITPQDVQAAAHFICALNQPAHLSAAQTLPSAAEACFSLQQHFAVLDRRLDRLKTIPSTLPVDRDAIALAEQLTAYWGALQQTLRRGAADLGLGIDQTIPAAERLISPSDFGFHNALRRDDGSLVFIDFEYAGWDDVAKLVADFFFQPAIPVDPTLFDSFTDQIVGQGPNHQATKQRLRLLRPIFGVKWCCIMLNRFVPDMTARSQFADPTHDEVQRKILQLGKASDAFRKLLETRWHT